MTMASLCASKCYISDSVPRKRGLNYVFSGWYGNDNDDDVK